MAERSDNECKRSRVSFGLDNPGPVFGEIRHSVIKESRRKSSRFAFA